MYRIYASGDKPAVERAWSALAWTDPSPADAVDYREEGRHAWRLDAYAGDADAAQACLDLARQAAPELVVHVEPLAERDWVALSLEGLPAIRAGRFIVAGAHSLPEAPGGKIPICIEAGPAFGTGHHGTTLGCLLAYQDLPGHARRGRVLDVGTGTGVLAIAALKLGARRAIASDVDGDSLVVTRENARKNGVHQRLKTARTAGTRHALIQSSGPYDIVLANILSRPLIGLAQDIATVTAPGGHVILSGLLVHQVPLVHRAYAGRGLVARGHRRIDGWSTLVYRRPGPSQRG